MLLAGIYQSRWSLAQMPAGLMLRGAEWRFLLSCDGTMPAELIRTRLQLEREEAESVIARLMADGLVAEMPVTLEDQARHFSLVHDGGDDPQSLQEFLQSPEDRPAALPKEISPPPPFVPLQIPNPPAETPSLFSPVQPNTPMSLQSIINFILNQGPDATAGQLAIYRVFMGVDSSLLRRNGITSLRFHEDRLIEDPELQDAIVENIRKALHLSYPPGVSSAEAA